MASHIKEESRRRSMLPQLTTVRKSTAQTARQDHCGQTLMIGRSTCQATKSVGAPIPPNLGGSRSIHRIESENPTAKHGLEGIVLIKDEVKAPRTSGIVAPRSNYHKTPSRSNSRSNAQLSDQPADTTLGQLRQPSSEVLKSESKTAKPVGHRRNMSVTKQPQLESTLQRPIRSSSKQSSVSNLPSMSLLPSKKDQRPAFSTLQQHFTPKKTTKAPTASFFAPPSSKQHHDDTCLGEIGHLQMELAQLHLLHRNASTIQAQWEKSAERNLQCRFENLSKQHLELKEIACESQALINQSALLLWCQNLSDVQIAEKVQLLSWCFVETGGMLDSQSRYSRIISLFAAWSDRASQIRVARDHSIHGFSLNLDFIESIGDSWTTELVTLNKKLSSISRELESLGEVPKESSVSRVLVVLKSIVSNLMVELEVIRSIEDEIMTQEISWVQDMIKNLADDVDDDVNAMASSYKGVWRDEER